jgi:hypothetical protein
MPASKQQPGSVERMLDKEINWEDLKIGLEDVGRLQFILVALPQCRTGTRVCKELSLTMISHHRYNAKRRHWRKTRIGI